MAYKGLFVLLLFAFVSCNNKEWFSESQDFEGEEWLYNNPLSYKFNVTDTSSLNEINLDVTYNQNNFGYQNLYVNIQTIFPNGKNTEQIVSLEVLGEEAQMNQKCSDEECTVSILLLGSFKFYEIGEHTIKISQHSRENKLVGIEKLKMRILRI